MSWFNYIGLIVISVIMIPNIIYAIKNKGGFPNSCGSKAAELFEKIGRYGCIAFTVFNIPFTYFGFWFDKAMLVYAIVNSVLCVIYLACWAIFRKNTVEKAILLSAIPSCVFLFGGIMLLSIPLIVFEIVFAPCHILVSCKNVC